MLSNRLSAPFEGSLLNTYRILRTTNPSPYMFYFSGTDVEVAGASPETLVKLEDGVLHTFPLAGTRPRGKTDEEDKALEEELLPTKRSWPSTTCWWIWAATIWARSVSSAAFRSKSLHSIERYSHVMHIGSTVRGEIRDDKDALDAVEAVLPAGTLSGAPKIRACQLIGELENNKRGIYGGAIGYIDFTGNMDTCIAIRIAYKKNGKVFVRSGAGIVADSVPETEYRGMHQQGQGRGQRPGAGAGGRPMIFLIDNYDSFSYNLYQLVGELDPDIRVIRNDEMTRGGDLEALHPDRIILSPGPGRPEDAGILIETVLKLGPQASPSWASAWATRPSARPTALPSPMPSMLMHGKAVPGAAGL